MTAASASATGARTARKSGSRWYRWFELPWRAHDSHRHWFFRIAGVLVLAALGITADMTDGDTSALATVVAISDMLAWWYFLPASLLLARAAHHLRLPHARNEVHAGLCLYAVLTCVLPALLLGGMGGDWTSAAAIFVVCSAAFATSLMPQSLFFVLCFSPTVLNAVPMPDFLADVDYTHPATLSLCGIGFTLIAMARWHRLSRRSDVTVSRWRIPFIELLLQPRARHSLLPDESNLIRQRLAWLQPEPDVRGCGPHCVYANLRVALNLWAPQTRRGRLRLSLWMLLCLSAAAIMFASMFAQEHDTDELTHYLFLASGWIALFGCYGALEGTVQTLRRRWSQCDGVLPLLALLPGLGDVARLKRALLMLTLGTGLAITTTGSLVAWILVSWSLGQVSLVATLLIGALAMFALLRLTAGTLTILGHHREHPMGKRIFSLYVLLLVSISALYAFYAFFTVFDGASLPALPCVVLALLWACLLPVLLRAIVQGWQNWQRLPHPFLPEDAS